MAMGSYVAQILWVTQTLLRDYKLNFSKVSIFCDNTSIINIFKNPIQHSRTKHIRIRHHFIHDHVQKGDICMEFVDTLIQLVNIFTKPLYENIFWAIHHDLGMLKMN